MTLVKTKTLDDQTNIIYWLHNIYYIEWSIKKQNITKYDIHFSRAECLLKKINNNKSEKKSLLLKMPSWHNFG